MSLRRGSKARPRTLSKGLRLTAAAVVAAAGAGAVLAAAAAGGGAAERLDEWLAANESFRARFTQSVFDEDGLRIAGSEGTVAVRRPYRFRWDYETPEPQLIVADGVTLWWYDADLAQATARPVESSLQGTPAVLLAGRGRVDTLFQAASLPSREGVDWVELTPNDPGASFRRVRVGMRGQELRAIEMEDGFGQTTRIDFFDVESNPRLPDDLFRFTPPPETDVVRGE